MTAEQPVSAVRAKTDWRIFIPKSITVIAQEGYRFADFRAESLTGTI